MKVLLLRAARIRHDAGEIVEVSPAEAGFLISTRSAVEAAEMNVAETPEKSAIARETAVPVINVPEDDAEKPAKTTRRKKQA